MAQNDVYYFVIFSLFNFIAFFTFYVPTYFFERRIRVGNKRVRVSPLTAALLHFKGVHGERKLFSSRVGVGCELFAVAYFAVSELLDYAVAALTKNYILACRISVIGAGACLVGFLAVLFVIGSQIRRADAEREKREREKLEQNEIIGMSEADDFINAHKTEASPKELEDKHTKEPLPTTENIDITGISEGMLEMKTRQDNLLERHH